MNKTLVISIIFVIISIGFSQDVHYPIWYRIYDHERMQWNDLIQKALDGSYLLFGMTADQNGRQYQPFVIKTDKKGESIWHRSISKQFGITYATETYQSGFVFTGYHSDIHPYFTDAAILNADQYGDTLWYKRYKENYSDYATSIGQTADSGFVITGEAHVDPMGPPIFPGYVFLRKVDPAGDTLFYKKYFFSEKSGRGTFIKQTDDGGFLITGTIFSTSSSADPGLEFYFNILILKTDRDGNIEWWKQIKGDEIPSCDWVDDYPNMMIRDKDNRYLIVGCTTPYKLEGPGKTKMLSKVFIVKVDEQGNYIKNFVGIDSVALSGQYAIPSNDGGYIISARRNNRTVYLFNLDSELQMTDYKIFSLNEQQPGKIVSHLLTQEGAFVCAGHDEGEKDMFTVKFSDNIYDLFTTKVEDLNNPPLYFQLYQNHPNPFNPTTTIEYAVPERSYVEIRIIDLLGREMRTLISGARNAGSHQVTWNGLDNTGSPVASGVYFCSMTAEGFSETRKLLLIR